MAEHTRSPSRRSARATPLLATLVSALALTTLVNAPTEAHAEAHAEAQATPKALSSLLTQASSAHPSLAPHRNAGCERVAVRVHLTPREGKEDTEARSADLAWLEGQFKEASRLFAPLKVCFEVSAFVSHPSRDAHMKTRAQRTSLGVSGGYERGVVELFIVDRLDDVDVEGVQIRGVHWRDPSARSTRRWVILSRIARPLVLAHELGHYFSLPHGRDPYSIMNKAPRDIPYEERGFTKREYAQMKRAWRKMKRSAHLKVLH